MHTVGQTTRIFIPAKVTDNKFLMSKDPDYVKRLENLDSREKRALLYGEWELEKGRFFENFDRSVHVMRPFKTDGNFNYYVAIDYGLDMLAAYKVAVDSHGRAYVTDEVYEGKDSGGEGLIVSQAAVRIRELCGTDKICAVFAPPDLWSRQKDTGKSIAALFYENGVSLSRVSSARVHGWLELKEWLAVVTGEDGEKTSALRIFDRCVNLIRAMSSIQCDSVDISDCARFPHELTHAPDALRYFVSGRPRSKKQTKAQKLYSFASERPKRSGVGLHDKIKII